MISKWFWLAGGLCGKPHDSRLGMVVDLSIVFSLWEFFAAESAFDRGFNL